MAVFGNRGKKRGRAAWSAGGGAISGATDSGGDSDSADGGGSGDERCSSSSRPKKRFIWPEVCCAGLGWAGLGSVCRQQHQVRRREVLLCATDTMSERFAVIEYRLDYTLIRRRNGRMCERRTEMGIRVMSNGCTCWFSIFVLNLDGEEFRRPPGLMWGPTTPHHDHQGCPVDVGINMGPPLCCIGLLRRPVVFAAKIELN